jgi:hypothetical protein
MKLMLVFIFLTSLSALAQGDLSLFKNDREGMTSFNGFLYRHRLSRVSKKISSNETQAIFTKVLNSHKKSCSFELNQELKTELANKNKTIELKDFLYQVRDLNLMDDIVLSILLEANKIKNQSVFVNEDLNDTYLDLTDEQESKIKQLIISFEKRFLKETCFDEAYKNFYQELLKVKKDLSSFQLAILLQQLLLENRISDSLFTQLEQARIQDLHINSLTLSSYLKKKQSLRLQYPLRDSNEKSNFVSSKTKRSKVSRRHKLFEQYNDLQIILMGNVIKKLRARLESPKVEILVYDQASVSETIVLEPMERFRFAIKILRKEMAQLSLNTYFAGRAPSYEDLMTASYELGIIPAIELDEIVSLQEIWSPRRTFWEKAGTWVQTFSSIATILIPPPYGFLPALGVVVIQATQGQNNQNKEDPGSLF